MRRTLLVSACAAAAVLVVSPSDRALAGAGAFAAHAGKGQVYSPAVATPVGCRRCDDGCYRPRSVAPAYGYYAVPQPVYVPTYSYYAPSVVYQGPFGIYRPYPPTVVYDYPPPYRSYYSDWRYSRW